MTLAKITTKEEYVIVSPPILVETRVTSKVKIFFFFYISYPLLKYDVHACTVFSEDKTLIYKDNSKFNKVLLLFRDNCVSVTLWLLVKCKSIVSR